MNKIIRKVDKNNRIKLIKISIIIVLIVTVVFFVYITGGTKTGYIHLIYIPIIMSSIFWGTFVGLIIGMISGILLGPFMPLDVSSGIMQDPINWTFRLFIFSLIGFITGCMIDRIHKLNTERQERNLKSPFYDLPNVQKLLQDIESKIKSKEIFKLISIKLTNLSEIEKFIDNKLVFDIVDNMVKSLIYVCGREAIYSYEIDELILLVYNNYEEDCEEKIKRVLDNYFAFPISLNGFKIRVSLKVGIYMYQGEDGSPIEIYNKARIAYEQGEVKESGVYYYDANLENKRREIHNELTFVK